MRHLFNYRYYVLIAIAGAIMVLLFADKEDCDVMEWLFFHLTNKTIAVLLIILLTKLVDYWNPKGKIDALAKFQETITNILEK